MTWVSRSLPDCEPRSDVLRTGVLLFLTGRFLMLHIGSCEDLQSGALMATNFWICYECKTKGTEQEFRHPEGGHECPKCKNCDASFPWRKFRCLGCGFEEEQGKFFGVKISFGKIDEAPLDEDPVDRKWEYDCSEINNDICDSTTYEQIDDSTEPARQKLFELTVEGEDGERFFRPFGSWERRFTCIPFDKLTEGTRIVVIRRDYPVKEFKLVKGENMSGILKASSQHIEADDDLRIYLPRATSGDHQDWTPEQWFENLIKTQKRKVR